MPETQTAQEMFAQFGIDTRGQEEILAERAKRNMQNAMDGQWSNRYPGDVGMQKAGALLGTALANKFNNKLTAEELREQEAAKSARAAVQTQVDEGLYLDAEGNVDPVQRAQALQKEVAKALVRQNDDRGIAMLIQIGEREAQERKDALERRKDNLDIAESVRDAETDEYNKGRRVANEMHTVWPTDSLDPNDSVDLYIDASGNARKPDTMDVVYAAGDWSRDPPIAPAIARKAVLGELSDIEKALLPSDKERAQMNRRERDVMTTMELGIGITDAMKDSIRFDENGIAHMNIMSTGGKVSVGALEVFDNIMTAGRGLADTLIIGNEDGSTTSFGSSRAHADNYVKKNPQVFAGIDYGKFGIDRTDQRAQRRLDAIFTQYAYAKARLNEENGRISDVDFEHAIQQIAASATDPEALRQVLTGDIKRNLKEYDQWVKQIHPSVRGLVRTDEARAAFEETEKRWNIAFEGNFGTATNVGEGILDVPKSDDISVNQFLNGGYDSQESFLDSFIDPTIPAEKEENEDGS